MNQNPRRGLPGQTCFACERFIGPADACPYCGVDSAKSPVLRRLRYAALLLSVIGVGYLYFMAVRAEPGIVKIGDISPTMNFAVVRVKGEVPRDAYIGYDEGVTNYVSFIVADGTGDIQVRAYREVARELGTRLLPLKGKSVIVDGVLKVSAKDRMRIFLQGAEHVRSGEGQAGHD